MNNYFKYDKKSEFDLEKEYEVLKNELEQKCEKACLEIFTDETFTNAITLDDKVYISLDDINGLLDFVLNEEIQDESTIEEKMGMAVIKTITKIFHTILNKYDVSLELHSCEDKNND